MSKSIQTFQVTEDLIVEAELGLDETEGGPILRVRSLAQEQDEDPL